MNENETVSFLSEDQWKKIRHHYHLQSNGMDPKNAIRVLFEVDDILKRHKIPYFLSCGTALGIRRDNQLIPWDDEIDMEIFSEIFIRKLKRLRNIFIKNGFIVRATFRERTSKMSVFKNKIKVAMGSLYDNRKGYRCDLNQKFPVSFFENPEKIKFMGRKFMVPGPVEDYLAFYYDDWETPIKSYDPDEYLNKEGKWKQ